MKGLRSAIGFLTILPAGSRERGDGLAAARAWFPVVGILLGAILGGLDLLLRTGRPILPPLVVGAVLVAAMAVLTRGLHLDGFIDTCDALLGGFDRGRRLAILRDPHVGAFAVVGVVCLLLLKWAALVVLPPESRSWTIALVPCLSRWAMLLVMDLFPYARNEGLGISFGRNGGRQPLYVGLLVAVSASVVLTGPMGLALVAAAGIGGWAVGAWAARLLGGVTGDIYGAACEATEAWLLLLATSLTSVAPDALRSPLLGLL